MQQPQQKPRRNLFPALLLSVVLFGLAVFIATHRYDVIDAVTVWRYGRPAVLTEYANKTAMTSRGEYLLYATRAEVNEKNAFNVNCSGLVEQTVVLGCFSNNRIYVYDVSSVQLAGVKEVTMAHEMLHAAYERLDTNKRTRINELLNREYATISDPHFHEAIALYDRTEPGARLTELHSMLATERKTLSPELESYYREYFTDRSAVLSLYESYAAVFRELEVKQKTLVDELNKLALEIEAARKSYDVSAETLLRDIDVFNHDASHGAFANRESFTIARNALQSRQTSLEQDRQRINAMIDKYHSGAAELENLNMQAEQLHKSIDSLPAREMPKV